MDYTTETIEKLGQAVAELIKRLSGFAVVVPKDPSKWPTQNPGFVV